MSEMPTAKFQIGQIVKHRLFSFRGVIFDVDPVFSNTEEWWSSIPEESRPRRDQPHLRPEMIAMAVLTLGLERFLKPPMQPGSGGDLRGHGGVTDRTVCAHRPCRGRVGVTLVASLA